MILILNTRIQASRYVSSIYSLSQIEFFIAVFLGVCFVISRGKLQYFARLVEILLIIALLSLGISSILVIPEIDISDLTISVAAVYIVKNLLSKIFNTQNNKEYITPIILLAYVFSMWIVNNRYEYELLVQNILFKLNIVLGVVLPTIVLIIMKIKKNKTSRVST